MKYMIVMDNSSLEHDLVLDFLYDFDEAKEDADQFVDHEEAIKATVYEVSNDDRPKQVYVASRLKEMEK